jgi:hypothetical protein
MNYVLLYPEGDGIGVVFPCLDMTPQDCADSAIPEGVVYLVMLQADLPDPMFRDAWEADFTTPDGTSRGRDYYDAHYVHGD